jgi:hypothetical protein
MHQRRLAYALAIGLSTTLFCACGSPNQPLVERLERHAASLAAVVESDTLEACVAAHVEAAGGDASAVTQLDCGVAEPSCGGAPVDLSVLAPLSGLVALDLTGRCISDVSPIARLTGLERLELASNEVRDIRPLGALVRLTSLGLSNNPLQATWGFAWDEPFSRLTRLEQLDLDGAFLGNILPLAKLTNLRELSLRDNDLYSLRVLEPLTRLQRLHVDRALLTDIEPLRRSRALEELTLDTNAVGSVEPLRELVERGPLRQVSLRENCVASCSLLESIDADCSGQASECFDYSAFAPASALSVPIAQVESVASDELPVWTPEQVQAGYAAIRGAPEIRWDQPRGNCDGRALAATAVLRALGLPRSAMAYAFGNLRPLTTNDPAGFVSFDWHVAVVVRVASAGVPRFVVLDAALDATAPLPLQAWYRRLVDSRGAALDFSCASYLAGNTPAPDDPDFACGVDGSAVAVDAAGNLVVDPIERLRGSVCASDVCSPK